MRPKTGDPGLFQAVEEVPAGAAWIAVDEFDEAHVLLQGGRYVPVAEGVGEHARLLKVRPGRPELPGLQLWDAEVGQRDREPVVVSGRPRKGEGLLLVGAGRVQVARFALEHRTTGEDLGHQPGVAGAAGQADGFFDAGQRGRQVVLQEREPAELGEGVGGDGVIGDPAGDPDGLACYRRDRRGLAEVIEQVAGRGEGPGPGLGGHLGIRPVEQDTQRLEDLAAVAAQVAEPAQPRGQAQPGLGTAGIGEAERQRGADVVELGLQPVQPDRLVRAAQVRVGGLHQGQVVIAMSNAGLARLGAASQRKSFGGVLTDRLQHPVTGRTAGLLGLHQALADQGSQQVKHLPFPGVARRGDRFGGRQRPAPGEDRQLVGHDPLAGIEQVVGPVDQRAEGLMAGRRGTAPPGQQPEPLIEPRADLRGRQRAQPGRGKLKSQRNPV